MVNKIGQSSPPPVGAKVQQQLSLKEVSPVQRTAPPQGGNTYLFGKSESRVEEILHGKPSTSPLLPQGTHKLVMKDAHFALPPGVNMGRRRSHFDTSVEVVVTTELPEINGQPKVQGDVLRKESTRKDTDLGLETVRTLKVLFNKMDADGSGEIKFDEASKFWGTGFAKISAAAMFSEVDSDKDGTVTLDEFVTFWHGVKKSGYSDEEIMIELEMLIEGNTWVDWKDGNTTGAG